MAEVEIKGKISIDTGASEGSMNKMLANIKDIKKSLGEAEVGSKKYKEAQIHLAEAEKELNKTLDKNSGSFSKLKDTLGGIVPGFQGASSGAAGLGRQLWMLVANPIVAILALVVGGLMLLYKAFASTNEGADKMEQIMAGIGATINVLRDRVLKVGEAIVKFFSGDFKGALETARDAVSGIGAEIAAEFEVAIEATKNLQNLEDNARVLLVGRAKLDRDLAIAREIMNNADATIEERRAALRKVRAAEGVQSGKELAQARAELAAQETLLQSDRSDEELDKLAQMKAGIFQIETTSAQQLRTMNKLEKTMIRDAQAIEDAERKSKAKAIIDEAEMQAGAIADIGAVDLVNKTKLDAEKDRLSQKEIVRASSEAKIREVNHKVGLKTDAEFLENKARMFAGVRDIMSSLTGLLSQNTVAGKGLAVSGAIIDTWAAVVATLKNSAKTPMGGIPGYAIAQSIAVGIAGLASVKRILSVQVPGGGGGAGSVPSFSASAPLAPQQASTALDASSIQGVGNAAQGGVNRSFVLDADIKSNQERAARIARAARLA